MEDSTIKALLEKHHADELEDIKAYSELAKKADAEGKEHMAGVLEDIVDDEKSHAHMIEHLLKEVM